MGIKCILGFCEGSFPFTYLVLIFIGAQFVVVLRPIADKIRVKLLSWRGKILSYAGQSQLNLYLSPLRCKIFGSTSDLLISLKRGWCRNFLWARDSDKSKRVIVSWRKGCRPMDFGGLSIRDFVALNIALNLKFTWDSLSGSSL